VRGTDPHSDKALEYCWTVFDPRPAVTMPLRTQFLRFCLPVNVLWFWTLNSGWTLCPVAPGSVGSAAPSETAKFIVSVGSVGRRSVYPEV